MVIPLSRRGNDITKPYNCLGILFLVFQFAVFLDESAKLFAKGFVWFVKL